MKKLFTLLALSFGLSAAAHNNVGINTTTPNASAALDVTSTTQGMLVPRMTQTQRNAIATPATGLLIYQTDNTPGFYSYSGTAWNSLNDGGGGTTLPSQTGNAGKVLTTDGSNLSWGTGVGASYEVYATISTAQTTSVGSSLSLPDAIQFSSNTSPAVLTGSNTWTTVSASPSSSTNGSTASGSGSRFTAGTAGLYLVDIQLAQEANNVPPIPMLDFNGTGNSGTSFYGNSTSHTVTAQSPHKARGTLQRLVYMSANDYFIVRCLSNSSAIGNYLGTDGSNYIKIVKLR